MPRVRTNHNNSEDIEIDFFPDFCPVCHWAAEIQQAMQFPNSCKEKSSYNNYSDKIQIVFKCPRDFCGSLFLIEYKYDYETRKWHANKFYPQIIKKSEFTREIQKLSPSFVKIYHQAREAEKQYLDEIAGMAYRKALEFLIKDYCIERNSTEVEQIKKIFLGKCIDKYVTDPNIKKCAKHASWLGNDETHYERKFTDLDIKDLKKLINLTQHWISSEKITEQYEKEFEERSKAKEK